ncbi:diaminopimelate epimerase [Alkalicella caledoniensis]|uniref:Diaminopimelate epimerase n=1 Tax=Alkalicella caledoniensis TaxID=2731377 RepID=A0A7G9W758_ALKCA|nr:diaminopimelate epimerase [Alkalicella caledoniensis]QNO14520.1 diaminopimelate epimerase [Alkalicella caledoniensis]
MEFTKMQGLGNDFILTENLMKLKRDWPNIAKKLCHRNLGIGADGLILVEPSNIAEYKMTIYNSDGSLAKMCGNGIRCFGKYLYDKRYLQKSEFSVETDSGIKHLVLKIQFNKVVSVQVDMGPPFFEPKSIPVLAQGDKVVDKYLKVIDKGFTFTALSMGNPHAVIFLDEIDNFPVEKYGPLIEKHSFFPDKVNVEFVSVKKDGSLKMRVWERGVGETQACGTGACATLVAARVKGVVNNTAKVHLKGGTLKISWKGENVLMTGPAETVFTGNVTI